MRLWSLHPKYLDARGLVALWREALLAQAVLRGRTRGYTRHPQLQRFQESRAPVGCIAEYLRGVHAEATRRGYTFDFAKIARGVSAARIPVGRGQIAHEWSHLIAKLKRRDPAWHAGIKHVRRPQAHALFYVVAGDVAPWERVEGIPATSRRPRASSALEAARGSRSGPDRPPAPTFARARRYRSSANPGRPVRYPRR